MFFARPTDRLKESRTSGHLSHRSLPRSPKTAIASYFPVYKGLVVRKLSVLHQSQLSRTLNTTMPKRILFVFTSVDKTLTGAPTVSRMTVCARFLGIDLAHSQRRAGTSLRPHTHTTVRPMHR